MKFVLRKKLQNTENRVVFLVILQKSRTVLHVNNWDCRLQQCRDIYTSDLTLLIYCCQATKFGAILQGMDN